MKTIDEDIKTGQLKQVYLLYGEEAYLKKQYKDKLLHALVEDGDTMNFTVFSGKDINPREVIDLAETLPFFADRRVILIEDSGFFKGSAEELSAYLLEPAETVCFLFSESEIDKRGKLYKAAAKAGRAVEFGKQNEAVLTRWITGRIRKEGKQITKDAFSLFLAKTGTDMENIDKELEKLLCYTLERDVIEEADVEAVTTEQISNKIFEMVDLIAGHNLSAALDRYYDLLALKEPPMRILYLITRQFHILLTVKVMSGQGFGNKDIAAKAGCPEWTVRKNSAQARGFSVAQLKQALLDAVSYEEAVKTGRMNDQMAVELFILQYSKKE